MLSVLPALKNPTISALSDSDWVAVNTIIEEAVVRQILPKLKAAKAQGIVEYPLNKIVFMMQNHKVKYDDGTRALQRRESEDFEAFEGGKSRIVQTMCVRGVTRPLKRGLGNWTTIDIAQTGIMGQRAAKLRQPGKM